MLLVLGGCWCFGATVVAAIVMHVAVSVAGTVAIAVAIVPFAFVVPVVPGASIVAIVPVAIVVVVPPAAAVENVARDDVLPVVQSTEVLFIRRGLLECLLQLFCCFNCDPF